MAVWLLDGPTNVQNLPPDTHPIFINFGEWYPKEGLLMHVDFNAVGVVTLDGVYQFRGRTDVSPAMTSWWPERNRLIRTVFEKEWLWEPIAFLGQTTGPEEVDFDIPLYTNYVRLKDRRLYVSFRKIYGVVGSVTTQEGPELINFGGTTLVHPGRKDTEVFISCGGSRAFDLPPIGVFYDTHHKVLSSPYFYADVDQCDRFLYAPEYGVLVTVEGPPDVQAPDPKWRIWVWCLEVRPTKLSPTEVFEGEVKSGQVVTFRTRLTGDHDDGAEGELVNWVLTGAGILLDAQTKTDVEGYATCRVQYLIGETGTSVLEASVWC